VLVFICKLRRKLQEGSRQLERRDMASSSGSGISGLLLAAGTEEELRTLMEQRRARRMLSNRESARRSRVRKQRHLDDLAAQAAQLRRENAHAAAALGLAAQGLLAADAENAVLRTQAAELAARLHSLSDILACMNTNDAADPFVLAFDGATAFDDLLRSCPEMFPLC
jgi:hypothetical protein